ncbi:hypothetical protein K491DRAFT_595160 [Lophiostoma macrostomum CBS 122681]|uniref:RRM domain-containing protein n=1 Tax=Lophiostoma macrostomum CBS 122681 TaxID=1314788 RepID=A0A6A6TE74_9PLEO|nr:hypothetical protein K491DRAFT_595160 [Lophiostoma macrostomum CBS 122681]
MEGLPWETLLNWTKYLFSSEPDGYKALQEKQAYIESEEAKLNKIIEEVSAEEAKYHTTVDKKQLLNHIIVTNIAADAGEEELQCVFSYYQFHGITILKKKHPQNGTRAAYIDFYDRMSAWNASRVIDSIFGLKLRVRLAVDVDIPEKNMLLLHAASQEKKRKEAASGVDRADRDGGWF